MTRPTDADVDGLSQVYQASWKGPGTFKWGGADQGYIVRVSPKDYAPEPLPNFDQLTDLELIQVFKSPSHIRALAAQRTLLRRNLTPATLEQLIAFAEDTDNPLRARIAALYAVSQRGTDHRNSQWVLETIIPLAGDPLLSPFVYRSLGDLGMARLTNALPGPVAAPHFEQGLLSADPRTCLEAIVATTRQGNRASAAAIAQNLGHSDPRIAHTAFRALAKLGSADACFEVLDSSGTTLGQKQGAAYALMRMPRPDVVSRLLKRLSSQTSSKSRRLTLSALCRLYHKEAEWKGDSWGTRPDTRGPYYQLATWSESQRILTSLQAFLERAPSEEAAFLVAAMNSNRIQSNEALNRILDLAIRDEGLVGPAITQLASSESLPQKGIALLLKASSYPNLKAMDLAETVAMLARVDHPKALEASLDTLARLDGIEADGRAKERARMAFLKAPNLDSQYQAFVGMTKVESDAHRQRWSYAALLEIASREKASPEALETARSSLDLAWQSTALRKLLMTLASETRNHHLDARISAALSDLDPEVVEVAQRAARRLRLPAPGEDTSPRVVTLSAEETLAKVAAFKGDVTLGESVFLRAGCQACHTVNKNQALKGPYLGSIADTYRRRDLIESILDPNKSIAQGFVTHLITLKNDSVYTGFVTKEAASTVTLRDITSQEHKLDKSQIRERTTLPTSIMPPGLMNPFTVKEFASLIDYLESLVKKE